MNAWLGSFLLIAAILAGCQPTAEPVREAERSSVPSVPATQTTTAAPASTATPAIIPPKPDAAAHPINPQVVAWQGRWQGVEGTYLELQARGDDYQIILQDLDAARTFPATVTTQGLSFERDGQVEQIQAATGAATGMKWLSDKKDCLMIRAGEGFCRD